MLLLMLMCRKNIGVRHCTIARRAIDHILRKTYDISFPNLCQGAAVLSPHRHYTGSLVLVFYLGRVFAEPIARIYITSRVVYKRNGCVVWPDYYFLIRAARAGLSA